ncbi:Pre-mRNA-splicing factor CWC21 [Termitomyces sp. J132]|nr:Pre-mRNA-splicing factor CWC21 [Termitomyces sp. J132]
MYNGIGLTTPRGSGTNGYVIRNLSALRSYETAHDRASAWETAPPKHREPDEAILEHERKRKVEVKCLELQLELEDKGIDEDEIEQKVGALRAELLKNLTALAPSAKSLKASDTHGLALAKKTELSKMARALGTRSDYQEGDAFDKEKQDEIRIRKQVEREERERKKEEERIRYQEQKAKWEAEKRERDRLRRQIKCPHPQFLLRGWKGRILEITATEALINQVTGAEAGALVVATAQLLENAFVVVRPPRPPHHPATAAAMILVLRLLPAQCHALLQGPLLPAMFADVPVALFDATTHLHLVVIANTLPYFPNTDVADALHQGPGLLHAVPL